MPGQNPGLDERHLCHTKILVQQRVVQFLLFSFLIGFDDPLAAGIGEFHGATFTDRKIAGADLLPVDQRDGQPVAQPGPEFFHQIQCQRRAIGPVHVQKPDKRIQAGRRQSSDAVVTDQGIKEGEQTVDAVSGRAAAARSEQEIVALLFEAEIKDGEIQIRRHAFHASQGVEFGQAGQGTDLFGQRIGNGVQPRRFLVLLRLAGGAQKAVAAVLDFSGYDLTGDLCAAGRVVRGAKLHSAQRHARIGHTGHPGVEASELPQIIHRDPVFPAKPQGGRTDGAGAKHTDRFKVMNGDGHLAPVRCVFSGMLLGGEIRRIDRNLHLEGQMVPGHIGAGGSEIKRVLLDIHTLLDLGFEILSLKQLPRQPLGPVTGFRGLGQADVEQRTFFTCLFVNGRRHRGGRKQLMQEQHGRFRLIAQFRREYHFPAPFAVRVKHRALLDGGVEHFFQAKSLCAKLRVVIPPLFAFSQFEFDGQEGFRILEFGIWI